MTLTTHRRSSRQLYARGIRQHLLQRHQSLLQECGSPPLIVFMTVIFSLHGMDSVDEMRPEYLLRTFRKLYRHTLSALLGRHFNRISKKHLQPMVWQFIDHPSSKPTVKPRRKSVQQHWHIHSIWCVHSHTVGTFERLVQQKFFAETVMDIGRPLEGIDVQVVPAEDIETVTPYSSAFLGVRSRHEAEALLEVLPTASSEHSPSHELKT